MRDLGHKVSVIAWWGLEGGITEWEGIPVYPKKFDGYGNDATPYVVRKEKADILITLIDLWVMGLHLGDLGSTRYCPYLPIDHSPVPPNIAERFPHAHRLLVYSEFAERLVKAHDGGRFADKVRHIPHGINTDVLTPMTGEEKRAARKRFYPDWPDNAFVVGMVAANKGYPCRKSFPEVMEAFAMFAAQVPETRLYLHSHPGTEFHGPDLMMMARHFGITEKVRFPNPDKMLMGDYPETLMRDMYGTLDVLLSPSAGEGYGLPIVEAQSCGIPVAVTDFSAMSELVGAGWRIPPARLTTTMIWAQQADVHPDGVLHALWEAYRWPNRAHLATAAREFALRYSWPKVIECWGRFLEEMEAPSRGLADDLVATCRAES